MAGYNEWHAKVWPELQEHIRRTGTTNYSIFQGGDGLLFLYEERNEVLAAAAANDFTKTDMELDEWDDTDGRGVLSVSARWSLLMEPFLDPDYEFSGEELEHVMYMDPDPATRSMDHIEPSAEVPSLAPNPAWGEYESFTGGGGWSLSGRTRQASQLKCRVEGIPRYNEWHANVWPELQVLGRCPQCPSGQAHRDEEVCTTDGVYYLSECFLQCLSPESQIETSRDASSTHINETCLKKGKAIDSI